MRICSVLCRVVLAVLLVSGTLFGQSLSKSERSKLHPTFHAVLSPQVPQLGLQKSIPDREPSSATKDGLPLYDAIIYTADPDAVRKSGIHVNSVFPSFVTAQVTPPDLLSLVKLPQVTYLDPGSINYPALDVSIPDMGANLVHAGFLNNTPYKGKGAIVVIYDTGIDWKHFDFRDLADTTKTRILFLWDQTITPITGEASPSPFGYGVEYTKARIEAEFVASPPNFVRERDINGHGTHVASTAAGNGLSLTKKYIGVAPEADLIIVKGGDGSFSETRMIDGLSYAQSKAASLGKPMVLNWSIGGQTGPHDGTRPYEVAVDAAVSTPGKVVAISAGNDGASNIHFGGSIASGATGSISIVVPTFTPNSGINNDRFYLDIWFVGNASLRVTLTSPTGTTYTRNDGESGLFTADAEGTVDIGNVLSNLNNEKNVYIDVRDANASFPPRTGTWTLSIQSLSGTATYDGWLASRTVGTTTVTVTGANTDKTVSMPATSRGAITVASYMTKTGWPTYDGRNFGYTGSPIVGNFSSFSAVGPTRDGRQKPDIAAPGQGITAALSTAVDTSTIGTRIHPGIRHHLTQGTSMASPHVAGAAALLLGAFPNLTSAQIKSFLMTTANTDAFTGGVWNSRWGFGKLDVLRAMARAINPASTVQREFLAYDPDGSSAIFSPSMTGSRKYAVRFSPTITGRLSGMQINITTAANAPIIGAGPLVCEVFTNVSGSLGGIPGARIGNSVLHPFAQLSTGTNNFVDMLPANVTVTAGQDYHLVVSVANAQDIILVRADDGSAPTNRSSLFNGTSWVNVQDPASGQLPVRNLRIRVVVTSVSGLVSAEQVGSLPEQYELSQNFPNPFNPSTTIRYSIPKTSRVKLTIFDVMGRELSTLVNDEHTPGTYQAIWDGKTAAGIPVASGVYFYRLEGEDFRMAQKMVLMK